LEQGNVIKTGLGNLVFEEEFIANLTGLSIMEIDGVVGMSSRNVRDDLANFFGRENLSRGVKISVEDSRLVIELYLVLRYGVSLREVSSRVIEKVQENLMGTLGIEATVNVNVEGIE